MRLTVYTAVTAGYDRLNAVRPTASVRYVAFVEDTAQLSMGWELRPLVGEQADPTLRAKRYKVFPQVCLPDAACSLWLDGHVRSVGVDPATLAERYLKDADVVAYRHPERDCAYAEARVVLQMGLDPFPDRVESQMARYRTEGYPPRCGLVAAGILLRRHTDAVQRHSAAWWAEIESGSRRDQLSFGYACWRVGIAPATFSAHDAARFVIGHHAGPRFGMVPAAQKSRGRSIIDYIYKK